MNIELDYCPWCEQYMPPEERNGIVEHICRDENGYPIEPAELAKYHADLLECYRQEIKTDKRRSDTP